MMMTWGISRSGVSGLAVALALFGNAAAHAQSQEGASAAGRPGTQTATAPASPETQGTTGTATDPTDIVVTAQFRAQRLQDTPIAITALSGALMEARSQNSLTDLGRTAPNVTLQPSTSAYGNTAAISIRGVGQFDRDFGLEPGVGVYIDDVYYPTLYGAQLDLLDLERVEVLRGPQGTLAGKNSIGGAVKLYSKRATGSGDGYIEGTVGSYKRHDFRGSIDVPLVKDVLALRLAGVAKYRDGYVNRIDFKCRHPSANVPSVAANSSSSKCKIGTEGGQDFKGLRAALNWTPSSALDVTILGDIYSDQSDPPPTRLIGVNPASVNRPLLTPFLDVGKYESYATYQSQRGFGYEGKTGLNGRGVSGQVDYSFTDDLKLTSISAYRSYSAFYDSDLDGTSYGLTTQRLELSFRQFSQELRLNASLGDLIDLTVGGFYYDARGVSAGRNDITGVAVPPGTTPGAAAAYSLLGDVVKTESKSAFLHTILHPFDGLNVTLGVRYTDERKDLFFHRTDPVTFLPQVPPVSVDGVTGSFQGDRIDYRASVDYRWSDALLTYASFSTGFKGGGVGPRPFRPSQVLPFGPETIDAYEIGVKSDFFDRLLRVNISAFYNKYNDIQITISSGTGPIFSPPVSLPVNAGKATVKGIELETELRPTESLSLDGSASYLDFQYDVLSAGALASRIQLGYITPFTPKWKWSVGAQYRAEIADGQTVTPRIDASYQSSTYSAAINAPTALSSGFTLANARITYANDNAGWEAAVAVTNLFDNYYYTSKYDNQYGLTGAQLANVGRPREWSLTLKYKF